ncbi:MAG: UDP-N-acetylmuramoyl-tripeptide--D-alanyl-D-alanine ligase [Microbacteriaceae bacterium]
MIAMTLAEIAEAVQGTVVDSHSESTVVSGVVQTDSRLVSAGDIFFALRGAEADGHDFAPGAASRGAALLIVERELTELTQAQIVVSDGLVALAALAKNVLARVRAKGQVRVVAVTGSNGKTTTKNMLQQMLEVFGETVSPIESFNNEVGMPISVLKVTDTTEFLVVEMGASARGEIASMVDIAPPDVALVLKVGLAHLGDFGDIRDTQQAKAEMVRSLPQSSTAILNLDDAMVREMADWTEAEVRFFSLNNPAADAHTTTIDSGIWGTRFGLELKPHPEREVSLQILGEHHVYNALAALLAVEALGLDLPKAIDALGKMTRAERWRMEKFVLPNGAIVINDAYNASPDSAAAALKTLAILARQEGRRAVAVFGEMADLGEASWQEHKDLGILAVRLNISQLYVVGEGAKMLHNSTSFEGSWDGESIYCETIEECEALLQDAIQANDMVLFKSSKSANIRFLGDRITGVALDGSRAQEESL